MYNYFVGKVLVLFVGVCVLGEIVFGIGGVLSIDLCYKLEFLNVSEFCREIR